MLTVSLLVHVTSNTVPGSTGYSDSVLFVLVHTVSVLTASVHELQGSVETCD